jgi:hypothetical protein
MQAAQLHRVATAEININFAGNQGRVVKNQYRRISVGYYWLILWAGAEARGSIAVVVFRVREHLWQAIVRVQCVDITVRSTVARFK